MNALIQRVCDFCISEEFDVRQREADETSSSRPCVLTVITLRTCN